MKDSRPELKYKQRPKESYQRPHAEAVKAMRAVMRLRQNIQADFYDLEGEEYNWNDQLSKQWMPMMRGKVKVNDHWYPPVSFGDPPRRDR